MSKKVFGYIRVSTGEQGTKFSLQAQRIEIEKYCSDKGLALSRIFEDQNSGSRLLEREGLMSLLEALDETVSAVVATETDRLSRDVFQFGWLTTHLKLHGVGVLLVNEHAAATPSERAFAKVRAVFAEFETELRRARIARGLQKARQEGKFMNRPPLGYRMNHGELVVDDKARDVVVQIFLFAAGGMSIRKIAAKTGVKRSSVAAILKNRFYVDETLHGLHEPIVDESLWRAIRRRHHEVRRMKTPTAQQDKTR